MNSTIYKLVVLRFSICADIMLTESFYMNKLKQLRKEMGLTQIEAAKICGVSRRTFQTYEETNLDCGTYKNLVNCLKTARGSIPILPLKFIKMKATNIFAKYPQVQCAYLFGSYARGEATSESDIDILIIADPMGLNFYGLASDLEETFKKQVDLLSRKQITDNDDFLARFLIEGIKIYQNQFKHTKK